MAVPTVFLIIILTDMLSMASMHHIRVSAAVVVVMLHVTVFINIVSISMRIMVYVVMVMSISAAAILSMVSVLVMVLVIVGARVAGKIITRTGRSSMMSMVRASLSRMAWSFAIP